MDSQKSTVCWVKSKCGQLVPLKGEEAGLFNKRIRFKDTKCDKCGEKFEGSEVVPLICRKCGEMTDSATQDNCLKCGTPLPKDYGDSCFSKCPFCGRIVEHKKKVSWRDSKEDTYQDVKCQCGKIVSARDINPRSCPNCYRVVNVHSVEAGSSDKSNLCPCCGAEVIKAVRGVFVTCPICSTPNEITANSRKERDRFFCYVCQDYSIPQKNVDKAIAESKLDLPELLTPGCPDDYVIYKYPKDEFSCKSRLIVPDGTVVICRQNGRCKRPWEAGDYLLSETDLDRTSKLLGADEQTEYIYKTEIFSFRKQFKQDTFQGITANGISCRTQNNSIVCNATATIKLILQLVDPAAFLESCDFKPAKWSELISDDATGSVSKAGIKHYLEKALHLSVKKLFSQTNASVKDINNESILLEKLIASELSDLLSDIGLRVSNIILDSFEIKETAESRKASNSFYVTCSYCGNSFKISDYTPDDPSSGTSGKAHYCFSCSKPISDEDIRRYYGIWCTKEPVVISPQCPDGFIVFKHPIDQFPFRSRLIVPGGTLVLCEQDGLCKEQWNPGAYELSQSHLSITERLLSGEGVVKTKIVCIRQHWDSFQVAAVYPKFSAYNGQREYFATFKVEICFDVADAKLLYDHFKNRDKVEWRDVSSDINCEFYRTVQNELAEKLASCIQGLLRAQVEPEKFESYLDRIGSDLEDDLRTKARDWGLNVRLFTGQTLITGENKDSIERREKQDNVKKAIDERIRKIRSYVETPIEWRTQPIRLAMSDNAQLWSQYEFNGRCRFRIENQDAFFKMSEAEGWLHDASNDDILRSVITSYYKEDVSKRIYTFLAQAARALVDQTHADIRDMERYFGALCDQVQSFLSYQISSWGVRVESVDMSPATITHSTAISYYTSADEQKTTEQIRQDIEKLKADSHLFDVKLNAETENAIGEITLKRYKEKTRIDEEVRGIDWEQRKADQERELNERLQALENSWKLKNAAFDHEGHFKDKTWERDIADAQKVYDENIRQFERASELKRKQMNEQIETEKQRIQAAHEKEREEQQHQQTLKKSSVEFDWKLNLEDAENKTTMDGILRRIDQSALDWRKKLDEYARLQRQLSAQDSLDEDRAQYDFDLYKFVTTRKARTEADRDARDTEIQLDEKEEELLEKVRRYAEEREKREDELNQTLWERYQKLTFEQHMEEERERVAKELEGLKLKYAQEEKLWAKDETLQKLQTETEQLKLKLAFWEAQAKASFEAEKFKAWQDTIARCAEATYKVSHDAELTKQAQAAAQAQQQEQQTILKQVTDLIKYFNDIEKTLRIQQLENEKNRDTVNADVEKARAASGGKKLDDLDKQQKVSSDQIRKLIEDLKKLSSSTNSRLGRLSEELKKMRDTKTKYCPNCLRPVPLDSRICPYCQCSLVNPRWPYPGAGVFTNEGGANENLGSYGAGMGAFGRMGAPISNSGNGGANASSGSVYMSDMPDISKLIKDAAKDLGLDFNTLMKELNEQASKGIQDASQPSKPSYPNDDIPTPPVYQ